MLRVAIVDDEPLARQHLEMLLGEQDDVEVVQVASGGEEALRYLESNRLDLMFLDIRMPGIDGIAVAEAAVERGALVVFTTAFEGHAIEAFDLDAVDYLLKPFDEERFHRALDRARRKTEDSTTAIEALRTAIEREGKGSERPSRFLVRDQERDRMVFVAPGEIDWIEACGNYVKLHTPKGRFYLRVTMKALEGDLPPDQFLRIRRSALVRVDAVRELHRASHGDFLVVLENGEELVLSRHYRDRLAELTGRG